MIHHRYPSLQFACSILVHWVVSPLYGHAPEAYRSAHLGMHHLENNGPRDITSTLGCRRNSFFGFLRYLLRYSGTNTVGICRYLRATGQTAKALRILKGEIFYLAFAASAAACNPRAALIVFLVPYLVLRWVLFAGNYAQHAFIDGYEPKDPLSYSTTICRGSYNTFYFNDGFHAEHHRAPDAHWTELPKLFEKHQKSYSQRRAMVFRDTDFLAIWFYLCFGFERRLASKFVDLSGSLNEKEIIELIRERTAPWSPPGYCDSR